MYDIIQKWKATDMNNPSSHRGLTQHEMGWDNKMVFLKEILILSPSEFFSDRLKFYGKKNRNKNRRKAR